MIIDLIIERKDHEALIAQGKTHELLLGVRRDVLVDGAEVVEEDGVKFTKIPLEYSAKAFYQQVIMYGEVGHGISEAMDYGTEDDVKRALCKYIEDGGYNMELCNYINERSWL